MPVKKQPREKQGCFLCLVRMRFVLLSMRPCSDYLNGEKYFQFLHDKIDFFFGVVFAE